MTQQKAFAYSKPYDEKVSTPSLIIGNFSIYGSYSFTVDVSHPKEPPLPGSEQVWTLNVHSEKGAIMPSLAGYSTPITMDAPLGELKGVDIRNIVGVGIQFTGNSDILITGNADSDVSSLQLKSGANTFTVKIPETAKPGDKITIKIPIEIELKAGVGIGNAIVGATVASAPVNNPIIEEMTVAEPPKSDILGPVIGAVIILAIIIAYTKRDQLSSLIPGL